MKSPLPWLVLSLLLMGLAGLAVARHYGYDTGISIACGQILWSLATCCIVVYRHRRR